MREGKGGGKRHGGRKGTMMAKEKEKEEREKGCRRKGEE